MIDLIKSAKTIQKALDKQTLENTTSGWMEENVMQAIYNGGFEIKIPKIDPDIDSSYIACSYEMLTLSRGIGKCFHIDELDIDENDIVPTITAVIAAFQRKSIDPRIDAYRYSKLAAIAGIREFYTPDKTTIMPALLNQLDKVRDVIGNKQDIVITISRPIYDKLVLSDKTARNIKKSHFKQGELDLYIESIDGVPMIPVPSARMKTMYTLDKRENINWIICPKSVPVGISKTDDITITTPETNTFNETWDIDYSKYYDLFIPDNKKATIAVSIEE